jgi:hypothetical protein
MCSCPPVRPFLFFPVQCSVLFCSFLSFVQFSPVSSCSLFNTLLFLCSMLSPLLSLLVLCSVLSSSFFSSFQPFFLFPDICSELSCSFLHSVQISPKSYPLPSWSKFNPLLLYPVLCSTPFRSFLYLPWRFSVFYSVLSFSCLSSVKSSLLVPFFGQSSPFLSFPLFSPLCLSCPLLSPFLSFPIVVQLSSVLSYRLFSPLCFSFQPFRIFHSFPVI